MRITILMPTMLKVQEQIDGNIVIQDLIFFTKRKFEKKEEKFENRVHVGYEICPHDIISERHMRRVAHVPNTQSCGNWKSNWYRPRHRQRAAYTTSSSCRAPDLTHTAAEIWKVTFCLNSPHVFPLWKNTIEGFLSYDMLAYYKSYVPMSSTRDN